MKSILIAEDNAMNRELLETMLGFNGYKTFSVVDGQSAVELAKETLPDLILMDIRMPGIDGYEARKRIANDDATASIPVIAITGNAMPHDEKNLVGQGFSQIIFKPYDMKHLLETVEKSIAKSDDLVLETI